jgi:hypothetical protein
VKQKAGERDMRRKTRKARRHALHSTITGSQKSCAFGASPWSLCSEWDSSGFELDAIRFNCVRDEMRDRVGRLLRRFRFERGEASKGPGRVSLNPRGTSKRSAFFRGSCDGHLFAGCGMSRPHPSEEDLDVLANPSCCRTGSTLRYDPLRC